MVYAVHDLTTRAWYETIGTDSRTASAPCEAEPTYTDFAAVATLVAATAELAAFRFYVDLLGTLETDVQVRRFDHRVGYEQCYYVGGQRFPYATHRRSFISHAQFMSYSNAMFRRRAGTMPDFLLMPGVTTFRPLYERDHWIGTDFFGRPQPEEIAAVWERSGLADPVRIQDA